MFAHDWLGLYFCLFDCPNSWVHYISLEELAGSDSFTDTVLQATQLALKTRSTEKRKALRNAITNSILPDAPDEILQQRFFNLIDEFSPWHLQVLKLLSSSGEVIREILNFHIYLIPLKHFTNPGDPFDISKEVSETNRFPDQWQSYNELPAEDAVKRYYPEIDSYIDALVQDLINSSLISRFIKADFDKVKYARLREIRVERVKLELYRWTTEIGEQFLKFIEIPF